VKTPTTDTRRHTRLPGLIAFMLAMCMSARGALVINEVCYKNSTVPDETGNTSRDWIELYNPGPEAVNVLGYGVYDKKTFDASQGAQLPDYILPAGGFLVVFADSDKHTAWTNNTLDIAAIPANTAWRYSAPDSAPPAEWKERTFDDTAWASGIAPLGYNDATLDMDCATALPYGADPADRHPTAYFRKTFDIFKPSAVTGLVVRARINDGMVLYLNGEEQTRVNMPDGTVSYDTLATTSVPPTLWTNFLLSASDLVAGDNVLAVEVHQAAADSVDLILDMTVTALVNERVPIVHGSFGLKKEGEDVYLFEPGQTGTYIQKFEKPAAEPGENKSYGFVVDGDKGGARQVYDRPTPGFSNATTPPQGYEVTLDKPTFSVAPGFYAANQSVVLSAASGSTIYYTLDGSDPWDSDTSVSSGTSIPIDAVAPATSGLAWIRTNPAEIGSRVPGADWRAPIGSVSKAVVLRAIAVSSDGTQCSPEARGTYFIGPSFAGRTLPAVAIITDTNNLFGFTSGIYVPGKCYADSPEGYGPEQFGKPNANYHQDNDDQAWERPVQVELFETAQDTAAFAHNTGMALRGGSSRSLPQKTLYLICRNSTYGTDTIHYPLFPGESGTRYKRFLLRNSGNDWYGHDGTNQVVSGGVGTMLKDAVFHRIVRNLDTSVMAYRPVTAYINGEYWGIHNLRESFDKHYLATRYGLDPDNMDILAHKADDTDPTKVKIKRDDGDKNSDEEYEELIAWIGSHPLSQAGNYERVQTAAVFTNASGIVITGIDVANHADYIIAETFFANTDWPIKNCDFWRAHADESDTCGAFGDTRWRWMLYDLDASGEKGADFNMFAYLSADDMTETNEPGFLINQLWSNPDFRDYFVNRYATLLNTTFRPERMAAIIADAADEIAPEIERHFRRWGRDFTQAQWRAAVTNVLIDFTATRHAVSWQHLSDHFNLGGTGTLTVNNHDAAGAGGRFIVNGIDITNGTEGVATRASWSGTFFRGLPVTVEAVPDDGYAFDGWVGTAVTNPAPGLSVGEAPIVLTARFRPLGAPAHQPTGYERWQRDNYTEQQVLGTGEAAAGAPSGCAGMSNLALYAFGMNRFDGLSDEERIARARLSIHARGNALWLGYTRLNDSFDDVRYTLKVASSLAAPVTWSDAATGLDLDPVALTNILDASAWSCEVRLPQAAPERAQRFFRLEAELQ
jgi:hypothetical protein